MAPAANGQKALAIGWLMWPAVGFVAAMIVFPFAYAIWLSLHDASLGAPSTFVGFGNYVALARDPEFRNAFKVTFQLFGMALAMQLVLGTWLGLVLNRITRFRNLVRTVAITPFMLPPVVVGMMAIVILDPSLGAANWVLKAVGIPPQLWLAHPEWVLFSVALVDAWQ